MNILFEINHPGHIHLFRNLAKELDNKGIQSYFLIKSEPDIKYLASYYCLRFTTIGLKGKGLVQKIFCQLSFFLKTIRIVKKIKPWLGLGVSINLPLVSGFTKMESISFDDDDMEVTPVFARFANKSSCILTPSTLSFENRGKHHITYDGFHELAYLHPNRFIPDPAIFDLLEIPNDTVFFILRFNSFRAHHDTGQKGMSFEQKTELIAKLKKKGKVFISTESFTEQEFQEYQIPDYPEKMHSFLAFATLYVGESQTMTTEASILGTPALKCNTFAGRLSGPNELEEKYGLCFSYLPEDFDKMLSKIDELLLNQNLKAEWEQRRNKMLNDKIDVTAFLVWFVENWPESMKIMKENPEYQERFK